MTALLLTMAALALLPPIIGIIVDALRRKQDD